MRNSGKWLVFVLFFCALAGCGKEKFSIPDQQTDFETYLKKNNLDTVLHGGVYRAYLDLPPRQDEDPRPTRKERLRAEAPVLTDTGAVVVLLGGKIAGNPLADAPTVDSLRLWGGRLNQAAIWLGGKVTEWNRIDLGPALDFGLSNLDFFADSLAAMGSRISAKAQELRQNRDSLRALSELIVSQGALIQNVGDLMVDVSGWPDPSPVASGDEVAIYYSGHIFNRTNGVGEMFTSNVQPIHNLTGADLFPLLPEPTRVRVGNSGLVRGIDLGLQGDIEQNYFQLFLTADMAYGGRYIGVVPPGSPVVFRIEIFEVNKP